MPNPALWGVMAACFNFVPYIGLLAGSAICVLRWSSRIRFAASRNVSATNLYGSKCNRSERGDS